MHSPNDFLAAIAVRKYLDLALRDHRQAVLDCGGFHERLWISAVLLGLMAWLLAHQKQPGEAYKLPLGFFRMLEGSRLLFQRHESSLQRLGYYWMGAKAEPNLLPKDKLSMVSQSQLVKIDQELTHLVDSRNTPSMKEEDKIINMEVKAYTLRCYSAYYSGASVEFLRPLIGLMPLNCGAKYRQMLERHDPLAMALMARALVLLKKLECVWWLNGEGEYEVVERNINGIRSLLPVELHWMADWPCKVLDRQIIGDG
ncbi:hypothetical protein NLG97_g3112 [Lecanicillium saksenae]|uniref:Uncharacterized protein n=1 Tax=Lecanicillium saksenae TaxID=468837 RepID=A0ACC1R1Q6_9HYPO|nr:hypothetical protein NLG97_g3112 [Lecanicillium saksenae]